MPIYDYVCDYCEKSFEIKKSMIESSRVESCPECHNVLRRIFNPINFTWGWMCWGRDNDGLGDDLILRHRDSGKGSLDRKRYEGME